MKAWDYCTKEDTRIEGPVTFGYPPAKRNVKGDCAKRNRMLLDKGAKQAVEDGDIRLEDYLKLDRAIREINNLSISTETLEGPLQNLWCWGPPRTGKSKWVREKFPGAYLKSNDKWWGFYEGQPVVIIDEMAPNQISACNMKKWADRYPVKVEAKNV
ncbi:MAG: helicase [Circoviridae sp.]|nr:MAG: helicase [Circoviridae sp.]